GVASAAVAVPAVLREFNRARPVMTDATGPAQNPSPSLTILTGTGPARTLPSESGVRDMRTVWPYVSRAEGYWSADRDVATGKHPELTDAARTAVTFVQRYVGPRVSLTAGSTAARDHGVGVVVNRQLPDGSSHPVTRVYLVRVSAAGSAPYVVAGAERPALAPDQIALTLVPPAEPVRPGDDHLTVSGTVRRPGVNGAPPVQVEIGDASGEALSFNRAVSEMALREPDTFTWTASISLEPGEADRAVTLAAWTLDDDASVLEFVATPVPLQSDPVSTPGPVDSGPGPVDTSGPASPTESPTPSPTG